MGNVLSIEFYFENHEYIGPFLIFCAFCLYAWNSLTTFKEENVKMTEAFKERTEVSHHSLEVTTRFFTNNPGIINVPVIRHGNELITPFAKACYLYLIPLIRAMIADGAEVNPPNQSRHIPFLICVSVILLRNIKDFSALDALLEAGSDINVTYPRTNWTSLHMAAIYKRYDLYDFLLNRGIDVEAADLDGKTAGMYYTDPEEDEEEVASGDSQLNGPVPN
ncbi:uncharacterized protein LOC129786722 isoform X1 [Lutzomyia longipalpis]|uniref:uncharacterized protein LOC129786722 isoform X1 n=1 Tax=Lutzomyia longipalpis TaxID=7200 RepID=UPI002484409F|nr:uncharacterized protein LOC129786722 isoform X1 [Lutzomyia longipalpis]